MMDTSRHFLTIALLEYLLLHCINRQALGHLFALRTGTARRMKVWKIMMQIPEDFLRIVWNYTPFWSFQQALVVSGLILTSSR